MLHIVGMPRSGTRAVVEYITDCMNACGIPAMLFNEPFNPFYQFAMHGAKLNINEIRLDTAPSLDDVKSRWYEIHKIHAGIQLNMKHVQYPGLDRFNRDVIAYLNTVSRWPWIIIRRYDAYEQMLSWLISLHTDKWHFLSREDASNAFVDLQPFAVDLEYVDEWHAATRAWESTVAEIKATGLVVGEVRYGNLKADCDAIIRRLYGDMHDLTAFDTWFDESPDQRVKRNTYPRGKRSMIVNIDEVSQRFNGWQKERANGIA